MGIAEPLHKRAAEQFVTLGRDHRLLGLIRNRLAAERVARMGLTVKHGPLTGFQLTPGAVWGPSDHLLKVVGVYEQCLMNEIVSAGPWRRLYNIGAADGFYGVGLVKAGYAESSACWEMDADSRALIAETAILNDISYKVAIHGEADADWSDATGDEAPQSGDLVLVDVEGFEYTLLSRDVLDRCAKATVMVELHPFLVEHGEAKESALIERARLSHDIRFVDDSVKDLTGVDELRDLSDDMRWLLCSEARETMMRWMVLTPKG